MGSTIGKHMRKMLAVLVAVCMVCSLNPVSAMAETRLAPVGDVQDGAHTTVEAQVGTAETTVHVGTVDSTELARSKKTYLSPGTGIGDVRQNKLIVEVKGAPASFDYEWTRTVKAANASGDAMPDTTFSVKGSVDTNTPFLDGGIREIEHALDGDTFEVANGGSEYIYTLTVHTAEGSEHAISFPKITVSGTHTTLTIGSKNQDPRVEAQVTAVMGATGTVTEVLPGADAYTALQQTAAAAAPANGKMKIDGSHAFTLAAGANGEFGSGVYTGVDYVRLPVSEEAVSKAEATGQVTVVALFEGASAPVSVKATIANDEDGTGPYVILYPDDFADDLKLGTFAVAYNDPEAVTYKVKATITSDPAGGQVSPTGEQTFIAGETATYTFQPFDNYEIEEISGITGASISIEAGVYTYTFPVNADMDIRVKFSRVKVDPTTKYDFVVNVTGTDYGSVQVNGETYTAGTHLQFSEGAPVDVMFIPSSAGNSAKLTVNGTPIPGTVESYPISAMTENMVLDVEFLAAPAPPVLPAIVTIQPSQHGSISHEKAEPAAGGAQKIEWPRKTGIVLNVNPDAGYVLDTLTLNGEDAKSLLVNSGTQISINSVLDDCTIAATFKLAPVSISLKTSDIYNPGGTMSISVNGIAQPSNQGTYEVAKGSKVRITFTPDAGYELAGVKANGSAPSVGYYPDATPAYYEFTADSATIIEANFQPVSAPPTEENVSVTVTKTAGMGEITPSGAFEMKKTETMPMSFMPGDGFASANVTVVADGKTVDTATKVKSYTLDITKLVTGEAYKNLQSVNVSVEFVADASTEPTKEVYTVRAMAGTGGSITPSGEVKVYDGDSPKFVVSADAGFVIESVLVDGVAQSGAADKAEFTATVANVRNNDRTVQALFKHMVAPDKTYYQVTVEQPTQGGSISPAGTTNVLAGSQQTLNFFCEDGYRLKAVWATPEGGTRLSMMGNVVDGKSLTFTVNGNIKIEAEFEDVGGTTIDPEEKTATLLAAATRGGSISPEGATKVRLGSTSDKQRITYTMVPEAGFELDNIAIESTSFMVKPGSAQMEQVNDAYSCTIDLTGLGLQDGGTYTVRATFKAKPVQPETYCNVTTSWTGTGSGTVSPEGQTKVVSGASQTIYFFPADGSMLSAVYVNDRPVTDKVQKTADGYSYTLVGITRADTRVEAVFDATSQPVQPVPDPYIITSSAGTGGAISPVGEFQVAPHGSATYSFIPDTANGYQIDTVVVDGTDITDKLTGPTYQFADVTGPHTIHVTFKKGATAADEYNLITTVVTSGKGEVSPAGVSRVGTGKSQVISFKPAYGFELDKYEIVPANAASVQTIPGDEYAVMLTNVSADMEFRVSFKEQSEGKPPVVVEKRVSVTATASVGGNVSPKSIEVPENESPTFTFTAMNGYHLSKVLCDGNDVTSQLKEGTYTFNVGTKSHTIAAEFEKDIVSQPTYWNVKASVDGTGGQISPAGELRVAAGGSATFSFIPDEGYEVKSISVNGGSPFETHTQYYTFFKVDSDMSIAVQFAPKDASSGTNPPTLNTYKINATSSIGGSIYPSSEVVVNSGANASFTFIPKNGYVLSYVTVDGDMIPGSGIQNNQYTFANVTADHAISAMFVKEDATPDTFIEYEVSAAAGGSITPQGTVFVREGEAQTFTVSAQYGYSVQDLVIGTEKVVEGGSVKNVNGVKYDRTTGQLTLSAGFAPKGSAVISVSFKKNSSSQEPVVPDYAQVLVTGTNGKPVSGGTVSPSAFTGIVGSKMTLSVIPDSGHEVDSVTVRAADGSVVGTYSAAQVIAAGYAIKDITVQKGLTIEVAFRQLSNGESNKFDDNNTKSYTVKAVAFGGGQVLPMGESQVLADTSFSATFLPDAGYELASVKMGAEGALRDVSAADIKNGTYTFKVTHDSRIEATFAAVATPAPITHKVNIKGNQDGGVTLSPSGELVVPDGANLPLSVICPDGRVATEMTVHYADGSTQKVAISGNTAVLSGITKDITSVTVSSKSDEQAKEPLTYKVNVQVARGADAGCKVSPTGEMRVVQGGSTMVSLLPAEGYRLASVVVDGQIVQRTGNVAYITNVSHDTDVKVYFEALPAAGEVGGNGGNGGEQKPFIQLTTKIEPLGTGSGIVIESKPQTMRNGESQRYFVYPDQGSDVEAVWISTESVKRQDIPFHPIVVDENGNALQSDIPSIRANATLWALPGQHSEVSSLAKASRAGERTIGYYFDVEGLTEDTVVSILYKADTTGNISSITAPGTWSPNVHITHTAGGTLSMAGDMYIPEGHSVSIAVRPTQGFELVSFTVNGKEKMRELANGMYTLTVPAEGADVNAIFAKVGEAAPKVTVTAEVEGGHGRVSPESAEVEKGGSASFTLIADAGYKPAWVQVDDKERVALAEGSLGYTLYDVLDATHLTFGFEEGYQPQPAIYHITTQVISGKGTISPDYAEKFLGESQQFTFTPDEGWVIGSVEITENGSNSVYEGEAVIGSYTFNNISADGQVKVRFVEEVPDEKVYYVSIVSGDGGHLYPEGPAIEVPVGEALTVYVYEDEGFELDTFEMSDTLSQTNAAAVQALAADLPEEGYVASHSFAVTGDGTLKATFKEKSSPDDPNTPGSNVGVYYTIAASAGNHGKITPSGDVQVPASGSKEFAFTPDAGYQVSRVIVDGQALATTPSSYKFTDVEADHTIAVEFGVRQASGAQDPATKILRSLQSLAQTGDLTAPAVMMLITLAFAAAGIAVYTRSRKGGMRKRRGSHSA